MWRKMQLNTAPQDAATLVRVARACTALTLDGAGVSIANVDLFRHGLVRTDRGTRPVGYVHVVFDDDLTHPDDVAAQIRALAMRVAPRIVVTFVETVVLVPDAADEDWFETVWPIAERLHALERQVPAPDPCIAEQIADLRAQLTPLLDAQNRTM